MLRNIFFAFMFALFLVLLISSNLFAQIPRTMNYQGKLTDIAGVGIDDTDRVIAFLIYDIETGGSPIWAETLSVNIVSGLFDVQLGNFHPTDLDFDVPYWIQLKIDENDDGDVIDPGDEFLEPREPLSAVAYSFRSVWADSVEGISGDVVHSLNALAGDLTLIGEGGIDVTAAGSNIHLNLTLDAGDCPNLVDLTGGAVSNQYVPTNLQTATPSAGQFLILASDIGCTGGRIHSIIFYTTVTTGTVDDVDIWMDNIYIDDLAAYSVIPSSSPVALGITLNIAGDNTVTIDLPYGFMYTGNNILITMRKNSSTGIFSNWLGHATPEVNARYNESSNTFPFPSTANFRPNIELNFLPPAVPDVVTDLNSLTGSINLIGGADIDVIEPGGPNVVINYTGTGGTDNDWEINGDGTPPDTVYNTDDMIGIGTANPEYPLHVYRPGSAFIKTESWNNYAGLIIDRGDTDKNAYVRYHTNAAADPDWVTGIIGGGFASPNSDFAISADYTQPDGKLYISRSTGNVGIGTIIPVYKLHVLADAGNTAVYGQNPGGFSGLLGYTNGGTTYSIYGSSGSDWAGYFDGDVNITGDLTVGGTSLDNLWTEYPTYIEANNCDGMRIYKTTAAKPGKIDANYIDPVLQIDGKQYSTWMAENIGLRVDVVGEAKLENGYFAIDLATQFEASDLWLFYHAVAENTIIPFVTAQDEVNLMAKMKGSEFIVKAISGEQNAKFSYRLTGKRIDEANKPPEANNRRDKNDRAKAYIDVDNFDKNGNPK